MLEIRYLSDLIVGNLMKAVCIFAVISNCLFCIFGLFGKLDERDSVEVK